MVREGRPLLADDGDDDDNEKQRKRVVDADDGEASVQASGISTGKAFAGLLVAAAVAAFCVTAISRKKGLGNAKMLSEMGKFAIRRPVDLSSRIAHSDMMYDPVVTEQVRTRRVGARRGRGAFGGRGAIFAGKGRGGRGGFGGPFGAGRGGPFGAVGPFGAGRGSFGGFGGGGPFGAGREFGSPMGGSSSSGGPCYSLSAPYCDADGEDATASNGTCVLPAADHIRAKDAHHICGRRQPRTNPCWVDTATRSGASVSCLPAFFILGEMKCGTTSMYKMVSEHPRVIKPTQKEPRYLTLPKYRHKTGGWYASHFQPAATQEAASADLITFDASPTYFNSPQLAPGWLRKWLPQARMIVLLRDPVQRTYSHWRMGLSWLQASPCYTSAATSALTDLAADVFGTEDGATSRSSSSSSSPSFSAAVVSKLIVRVRHNGTKEQKQALVEAMSEKLRSRPRVPINEIRMMREVFAFDAVARLGVMEVALRGCGASTGWGKDGGLIELSNHTKACVLRSHVGETVAGLWHARQALAAKRSKAESAAYAEGMRRVSVCSEYMLRAGAGVWRSSRYAENLASWYDFFPKPTSQMKVIATEEMESDPKGVMAEVYRFLGLPPIADVLTEGQQQKKKQKEEEAMTPASVEGAAAARSIFDRNRRDPRAGGGGGSARGSRGRRLLFASSAEARPPQQQRQRQQPRPTELGDRRRAAAVAAGAAVTASAGGNRRMTRVDGGPNRPRPRTREVEKEEETKKEAAATAPTASYELNVQGKRGDTVQERRPSGAARVAAAEAAAAAARAAAVRAGASSSRAAASRPEERSTGDIRLRPRGEDSSRGTSGSSSSGGSGVRYCVRNKKGVMDAGRRRGGARKQEDEEEDAENEESSEDGGGDDTDDDGIGECTSDEEKEVSSKDGRRRYKDIDGETKKLLQEFFAPFNQRLFKLLGRELPWEGIGAGMVEQRDYRSRTSSPRVALRATRHPPGFT